MTPLGPDGRTPAGVADRIRLALDELDAVPDLSQGVGPGVGAWTQHRVATARAHLDAALADLEQAKPADLTDGQELLARLDVIRVTRSPPCSSTSPLRHAFEKVDRRASELRRLRAEGRWIVEV